MYVCTISLCLSVSTYPLQASVVVVVVVMVAAAATVRRTDFFCQTNEHRICNSVSNQVCSLSNALHSLLVERKVTSLLCRFLWFIFIYVCEICSVMAKSASLNQPLLCPASPLSHPAVTHTPILHHSCSGHASQPLPYLLSPQSSFISGQNTPLSCISRHPSSFQPARSSGTPETALKGFKLLPSLLPPRPLLPVQCSTTPGGKCRNL